MPKSHFVLQLCKDILFGITPNNSFPSFPIGYPIRDPIVHPIGHPVGPAPVTPPVSPPRQCGGPCPPGELCPDDCIAAE